MKMNFLKIAAGVGAVALLAARGKKQTAPAPMVTWRLLRNPGVHPNVHPGDLVTLDLEIIQNNGQRSVWDFKVIAEKNRGECSVYKKEKDCLFWTGKVAHVSWPSRFEGVPISPKLPMVGDSFQFESEHAFEVED